MTESKRIQPGETIDPIQLADEIIAGRRLGREDDLTGFIDCDLAALKKGADKLRAYFCGEKVDLCTIIAGREGRCRENCKFCAQSIFSHTNCDIHDLLDTNEIEAEARANQEEGVDRFAIVDSGKGPTPEDFEKLLATFKKMKKDLKIGLCASLGFMTEDQFRRLYEAGVTSYHNNIETSRRYFPHICTTHTFEDKIANIKRAQKAGFCVCSGGIIGMGEDWEDRIDMALTLNELGIESIPVNSLMPIPGTPLANLPRLTEDEILRTISIFRFINPEANIRLAGGRALMANDGKETFTAGASASITGNMLTTSGSTIQSDKAMLESLGRSTVPDWESGDPATCGPTACAGTCGPSTCGPRTSAPAK